MTGHAVRTETIPVLAARIVAEPRMVAPTTVAERKEFAAAVVWMGDANSPKDVGVVSAFSAGQRLTLCKMLGAAHSSDIATTAARSLCKLVPPAVVPGGGGVGGGGGGGGCRPGTGPVIPANWISLSTAGCGIRTAIKCCRGGSGGSGNGIPSGGGGGWGRGWSAVREPVTLPVVAA